MNGTQQTGQCDNFHSKKFEWRVRKNRAPKKGMVQKWFVICFAEQAEATKGVVFMDSIQLKGKLHMAKRIRLYIMTKIKFSPKMVELYSVQGIKDKALYQEYPYQE